MLARKVQSRERLVLSVLCTSNVHVVCYCSAEAGQSSSSVVITSSHEVAYQGPGNVEPLGFVFDHILGPECDQAGIFRGMTASLELRQGYAYDALCASARATLSCICLRVSAHCSCWQGYG